MKYLKENSESLCKKNILKISNLIQLMTQTNLFYCSILTFCYNPSLHKSGNKINFLKNYERIILHFEKNVVIYLFIVV